MKIITLYNRATEQNPAWEVYGVKAEHSNEHLGTFSNKVDAIMFAHTHGLPVQVGTTNSYSVVDTIRKLIAVPEGDE